jgi:hypothetical protein
MVCTNIISEQDDINSKAKTKVRNYKISFLREEIIRCLYKELLEEYLDLNPISVNANEEWRHLERVKHEAETKLLEMRKK